MSSSTSKESDSIEQKKQPKKSLFGRNFVHLDRMDNAIRVFIVLSIVALVAAVVLIALSQARYVHPLCALYAFCGCVGSWVIVAAIHCCQHRVAEKKYNIKLETYREFRQPAPKKRSSD